MRLFTTWRIILIVFSLLFPSGISTMLYAEKIAVIDAGSSGSRFYVYEVRTDSPTLVQTLYPRTPQQKKNSKGRPLSGLVPHTDSLSLFLQQLTDEYPGDSTSVYIIATAGMRLKPQTQADSVYNLLKQLPLINGYYVKEAMTLSGAYEGLYAWLAANYANGTLSHESGKPYLDFSGTPCGILEIGGASMQLAFHTSQDHKDCLSRPGIGNVYCKSYLGGGVDQIFINSPRQGTSYTFNLPLESVSYLFPKNLTCWGIGKPISNVLKGMEKQGKGNSYKKRINGYIESLNDFEDIPQNYHPRINSHYIRWVLHNLNLEKRIRRPDQDPSWTIGAAIDIAVYNEQPQPYVCDKKP